MISSNYQSVEKRSDYHIAVQVDSNNRFAEVLSNKYRNRSYNNHTTADWSTLYFMMTMKRKRFLMITDVRISLSWSITACSYQCVDHLWVRSHWANTNVKATSLKDRCCILVYCPLLCHRSSLDCHVRTAELFTRAILIKWRQTLKETIAYADAQYGP